MKDYSHFKHVSSHQIILSGIVSAIIYIMSIVVLMSLNPNFNYSKFLFMNHDVFGTFFGIVIIVHIIVTLIIVIDYIIFNKIMRSLKN